MQKARIGVIILILGILTLFFPRLKAQIAAIPGNFPAVDSLQVGSNMPIGSDPLTAQEIEKVLSAGFQSKNGAALRSTSDGEQEVLLVERHEVSKAEQAAGKWRRQGDLFVYDYGTDSLIHSLVDIESGAVVAVERLRGVQLPLTQREEARVLTLVQEDVALWSTLRQRFQTITGEELNDFGQLQVKVSLFLADSMPDQVNQAARKCGQHRCAQALIFTADKTLLELTPIVDLSQGEVVQIWGEGAGG